MYIEVKFNIFTTRRYFGLTGNNFYINKIQEELFMQILWGIIFTTTFWEG